MSALSAKTVRRVVRLDRTEQRVARKYSEAWAAFRQTFPEATAAQFERSYRGNVEHAEDAFLYVKGAVVLVKTGDVFAMFLPLARR